MDYSLTKLVWVLPHAHAVAKVDHPAEQGYVAMMGVFIDTFVILTLTALVILTSHCAVTGGLLPQVTAAGTVVRRLGINRYSAYTGRFLCSIR